MKLLMVLILFTCSLSNANAQNNKILKRDFFEEFKLKKLLNDTLGKTNSLPFTYTPFEQNKMGVLKFTLKSKFLNENSKGDKIYAMNVDNMPCLVPGKTLLYNMPIAGMEKQDNLDLPLLKKR